MSLPRLSLAVVILTVAGCTDKAAEARMKQHDELHAKRESDRKSADAAKAKADEKERQDYYEKAIADGKFWVGMTTEQAQRSLGKPTKITTIGDASKKDEYWHYGTATTLLFRDGKLIRYSN